MSDKQVKSLLALIEAIELRVKTLEGVTVTPQLGGYNCNWCGVTRPSNWYVYEIEKDGEWITPCCAICARETKSRGPFPPKHKGKAGQ